VAVLHRWRLDVGNEWRGVVIDSLIPSLFSVDIIIFTSTKREHSDWPWCEQSLFFFWSIILGGEDRRQSMNYGSSGY